MTTETPELALEELARRIDADGTASQIGSADEVREIAAMVARRSAASAEPAVAVKALTECEFFEAVRSIIYKRVSSQVDTHFVDRIHLVGVPDAAAEIVALAAPPPSPVVSEAMVRALAEVLLGRVNAPEQEIWRASRDGLNAALSPAPAGDICIDCDGSGRYPSGAKCISCGGSGRVLPGDGLAPAEDVGLKAALAEYVEDMTERVGPEIEAAIRKRAADAVELRHGRAPAGEVRWRTVVEHLARQREWSERTFGPGNRTQGVLDHIRKELDEIEADPLDIAEWVDVIILAFDGAWRAGWEPEAIVSAWRAKQAKNEARQWPDWRTAAPDKAIEHIRDLPASPTGGDKPCGLASPSYHDCPNMKEVGGGMEGERYRCAVCGKSYFLDYEDMK